jgi:spermidine/putrescine-binding protein
MRTKVRESIVRRCSRRQLGRLLAGSGLSLMTISAAPRLGQAGGRPVLYTWEGFDSPDLVADFLFQHPAPLFQTFVDENEAFENLKAGLTVDLAHPCADTFGHWRDAGLLQPIDTLDWRTGRTSSSRSNRFPAARSMASDCSYPSIGAPPPSPTAPTL